MRKYEVRFHSVTSHPYYIMAESAEVAKAIAVHKNNSQSQTKLDIGHVAYCELTHKVPLDSVNKPYTKAPQRRVNVPLNLLESHIEGINEYGSFVEQPEFQRAHVWTEDQQIKFVEHLLNGGQSGLDIYLNCPGWDEHFNRAFSTVVVDGLQRLTAVRKFLAGDLKVFGGYTVNDFEYLNNLCLNFNTNDLKTDAQVLQWYLEMNAGGTPHTEAELNKVRRMLEKVNG